MIRIIVSRVQRFTWASALAMFLSAATEARAQDPEPAEPALPDPPAAEAPSAEAEAEPPAPEPAPPAPVAAAEPLPPEPAPAMVDEPEEMEPAEEPPPSTPNMNMGVGVRVGVRMQNPDDPEELDDLSFDNAYVEFYLNGRATDLIGWTANFNASALADATGTVGPVRAMDLIAQFDFHDLFHVWAGRLLVPSDRSNFSGPFFMSPWNYPGVYGAGGFVGPKTKASGRDVGAAIWGDYGGGVFKYYVSAFDLDQAQNEPLWSGRLALALVGKEPGFYHSSTYYGSQDVLALGAWGQAQTDGTSITTEDAAGDPVVETDDFLHAGADILAEFNLGDAGTLTGEAAYYWFDGFTPVEQGFYVLASYLFAQEVGIGKFQPLVRVQRTMEPEWMILDAFLAYVIKDYAARIHLGYQRIDLDDAGVSNAVQLGAQIRQ